ncbi:hypothetical protein TNCV_3526591 [Trichonephila clavipes]|nr:hypothetical protein TNCV_3526591 [Trichonephila clavipes]
MTSKQKSIAFLHFMLLRKKEGVRYTLCSRFSGQGQGLKCPDFEPRVAKETCRGSRCTLYPSRLKRSPVVWYGSGGGASSGVVLVTRPWFKITRSVANNHSAAS